MTDPLNLNQKCDHEPCHCVPGPDDAFTKGKSVFCSEACADGKGCDHTECNCGDYRAS